MDTVLQIAGLSIVVAVLCTIVRKTDHALSTAAVLLFCVLALLAVSQMLTPVVHFLRELAALTGVDKAYLVPVAKTCALCVVTQIAANVCSEAGASTLAQMTQLCGTVAGVYLLLPLLQSVLELVRTLMGG